MRTSPRAIRPAAVLAVALLCAGRGARAQDRFEVEVYDADTEPSGHASAALHVNHVALGTTAAAPSGEAATQRLTRFTLEPQAGLNRYLELGVYVQAAVVDGARLDYAGMKVRLKARVPTRYAGGRLGLAANLELSSVPPQFEANRWGVELRPILDLAWRRLRVLVNPIVSVDLAGARAGRPDLEPAAKVSLGLGDGVALGAEYYAGLGTVWSPDLLAEQTHRLFAVLDLRRALGGAQIDLDLGAGYGFAGSTDRLTFKMILGIAPR